MLWGVPVLVADTGGGAADAPILGSAAVGDGASLVINEVMAANTVTARDPQNEYEDWVEIYNPADTPVDVGGLYLTDNPVEFAHQVEKFPASADAVKIKPLNFVDAGTFAAGQPVGRRDDVYMEPRPLRHRSFCGTNGAEPSWRWGDAECAPEAKTFAEGRSVTMNLLDGKIVSDKASGR